MPFLLEQMIIVDQIENNQILVEWDNYALSVLCTEDFPHPPKEGERFLFILKEDQAGTCSILQKDPIEINCTDKSLILPLSLISDTTNQPIQFRIDTL